MLGTTGISSVGRFVLSGGKVRLRRLSAPNSDAQRAQLIRDHATAFPTLECLDFRVLTPRVSRMKLPQRSRDSGRTLCVRDFVEGSPVETFTGSFRDQLASITLPMDANLGAYDLSMYPTLRSFRIMPPRREELGAFESSIPAVVDVLASATTLPGLTRLGIEGELCEMTSRRISSVRTARPRSGRSSSATRSGVASPRSPKATNVPTRARGHA